MFKLIFFFFVLFVIYKALQFLSKLYRFYEAAQKGTGQQQHRQTNGYRKQHKGQTTIYYDPSKAGEEERSTTERGKDEDYIDYKEIKE